MRTAGVKQKQWLKTDWKKNTHTKTLPEQQEMTRSLRVEFGPLKKKKKKVFN